MDLELKFSKNIKIQVNKSNKILGLICGLYKYMDGKMLKILFIALVRPLLEFGNVEFPRLIKDCPLKEYKKRATKLITELRNLPNGD